MRLKLLKLQEKNAEAREIWNKKVIKVSQNIKSTSTSRPIIHSKNYILSIN